MDLSSLLPMLLLKPPSLDLIPKQQAWYLLESQCKEEKGTSTNQNATWSSCTVNYFIFIISRVLSGNLRCCISGRNYLKESFPTPAQLNLLRKISWRKNKTISDLLQENTSSTVHQAFYKLQTWKYVDYLIPYSEKPILTFIHTATL